MADKEKNTSRIELVSFGCRLNIYESEVMQREATKAGLGDLPGGAVLINTCAVTGEAVRQAKQAIRRARRENPQARIIVTGCAAQTEAQSFAAMDEVDLVIGNDDKLHAHSYRALPDFGVNDTEKLRVNDIMSVRETASHMVQTMDSRSRAFVQVQNGCDHRCTFCIIPFGRGPSRSVPMGEVVREIAKLVENGFREVVLTGVDTTSYGADLPGAPGLGTLVRAILDGVPKLERLRLSSIDSIEVDETLMETIIHEPRFMPHLHLSLQHGNDMILKRMKRRHLRAQAVEFCNQVKSARPDMVFGADLIAGFPTEDEAMFADCLSIVDECSLTHLHVFPFSPREGTPAARMPQLERAIIKERAKILREKGEAAFRSHLDKCIGKTVRVLVESDAIARAEDFTPVHVKNLVEGKDATSLKGSILEAKITGHDNKALLATAIYANREQAKSRKDLING